MSIVLDRGLSFVEADHAYYFEGKRVPNVTLLLDKLHTFAGVPLEVLEAAKRRGSFVHRMCELDDLGDLEEDERIEPYLGYLKAWRAFKVAYAPNWSAIEARGYSRRFKFAGTLDRRGVFKRGPRPGVRVLPDIKTSEQSHWLFGVQTAAYRQIVLEHDPLAALDERCTIQLFKDGRFLVLFWNSPADWETFAALLHLHYRQEAMQ